MGCKKKVKKVLKGIDGTIYFFFSVFYSCMSSLYKLLSHLSGVYTAVVDSQQHKVIVTGNVEAETLIKKLYKSGKHAELWPQMPETKEKKKEKPKKNDKTKDAKEGQEVGGDDKQDVSEKAQNAISSNNPQESVDIKGGESEEETGGGGGDSAGGKKKKKKKKKGQTGNGGGENVSEGTAAAGPESTGSPMATPEPIPSMSKMNLGSPQVRPPNHQEYPYPPPMYYPLPTPMYGVVSYNTAYPTANTSYYAPALHAYSYSQPPRYMPFPPSDPIHNDNDDDDYAVGCSIM